MGKWGIWQWLIAIVLALIAIQIVFWIVGQFIHLLKIALVVAVIIGIIWLVMSVMNRGKRSSY